MPEAFRQVGEFSSPSRARRLVRSVKSPLDKCTIVSIYPRPIVKENKWTIEPGIFDIDAGSYEKPAVKVVGPSSWWKDINEDQPMIEIPVSSVLVAESVVKDYSNGMLGCNMSDSMPGLFFILGECNSFEAKTKYAKKMEEMRIKQNNWYLILVHIADSLWARSNGNPLAIWDLMRLAARELNLNDKPWLKDFITIEKVKCIGCGSLKDPEYPVCPVCKTVDMLNPKAKDLKFAV